MTSSLSAPYPIELSFDPPEKVARWRALFSGIVLIPHVLVMYVLGLVSSVCVLLSWFAIVFTGKQPAGLAQMPRMYVRYAARVQLYGAFLSADYPPFTFDGATADPGDVTGVRVDFREQLTDRNRVTVFFRYFMIIPHAIVLAVLALGALVCFVIAFFAVLFTGRWPEGLRAYVVKVMRWALRVQGYFLLVTDEYPPFELS